MSNVDWKNVVERLVSTTVQAAVGAVASIAEAVATGQLDWKTALTGVAVAALLSFAKNLQVELSTPPAAPTTTFNIATAVPGDAERQAALVAAQAAAPAESPQAFADVTTQ